MTSPLSSRGSFQASKTSPQLNSIVDEFTRQLTEAAERASAEQSERLLREAFATLRAEENRRTLDEQQWLEDLTQQLIAAVGQIMQDVERGLIQQEISRRSAQTGQASDGIVRRKPRRKPVRPAPPPLDPEQIKRDQEFARLRAILKPVADVEPAVPPVPTPAPVVATVHVHRPSSPGDSLRALEKEIQDAVPSLGTLGPERCSAQIAAWVGQVRGLRDRLPAEVSATMRPAFRIFLEHLDQLRVQMEANLVDALEQKWKAPNWDVYVEVNRALAEQRPPNVSRDELQMHYRSMLRALVQPHRRNVPQQALPIIEQAAKALPAEDNLLQSARRRHRLVAQEPRQETPQAPATEKPAAPVPPRTAAEENAFPADDVAPVTSDQESEFDSPWIK